jgi:HD-like signal output (HDOD) protein
MQAAIHAMQNPVHPQAGGLKRRLFGSGNGFAISNAPTGGRWYRQRGFVGREGGQDGTMDAEAASAEKAGPEVNPAGPSIETIVEQIRQLKPVSDCTSKVFALLDDPESGMGDLAKIIGHEPALTGNVLKLANSAYFGLPGKIGDTQQAVIYLGMAQVIDMVLLTSCAESFAGGHAGYGLESGELWKSAVSGAILAEDLGTRSGCGQRSLIFTGALLRDVGKIVLSQYVRTAISQIQMLVDRQAFSFPAAEKAVLGVDHAEVGAMIAGKWNFPTSLQIIISNHHTPQFATACAIETAIVHMADSLARTLGVGAGVEDEGDGQERQIARSLGLNDAAIQEVIDGVGRKLTHLQSLFS